MVKDSACWGKDSSTGASSAQLTAARTARAASQVPSVLRDGQEPEQEQQLQQSEPLETWNSRVGIGWTNATGEMSGTGVGWVWMTVGAIGMIGGALSPMNATSAADTDGSQQRASPVLRQQSSPQLTRLSQQLLQQSPQPSPSQHIRHSSRLDSACLTIFSHLIRVPEFTFLQICIWDTYHSAMAG